MNMYKVAVNIHVQYLIYIAVGRQHCSASHSVAIATIITFTLHPIVFCNTCNQGEGHQSLIEYIKGQEYKL